MRIIKRIIFLFATVALLSGCSTQVKNPEWVINEVMVVNETNFVDDFGQRHGWIEIYNNTAKTMDLGGRFLTNDPNNPKKYPIPRGDVLTRVKPHQHVLFFADEKPINGTFDLHVILCHVVFDQFVCTESFMALFTSSSVRRPFLLRPLNTFCSLSLKLSKAIKKAPQLFYQIIL